MAEQSSTPISVRSMAYEEAAMAVMPMDLSSGVASSPATAAEGGCHSSDFGFNGSGSTHGMIGIGAPTDTGSSKFKPDGEVEIDPHPTS